MNLKQIGEKCKRDENYNIYFTDNFNKDSIIGMFYFRALYQPDHFDIAGDQAWKIREMVELSTSVKVPDVDNTLANFKIFQYELEKREVLTKYLKQIEYLKSHEIEGIADDLLSLFEEIYYTNDLKPLEKEALVKKVKENYQDYILKPMREGGGSNLNNEEVRDSIENDEIVSRSIIMKRIRNPEYDNILLTNEKFYKCKTITEYSIYGSLIVNEKAEEDNQTFGYLLRTKNSQIAEGGVFAGVGHINIGYLVDSMP